MHTPRIPLTAMLAALAMVFAAGCDDTTAPTTGAIQVNVATTGADLDPDGYLLSVDGGPSQRVTASGAVTVAGLAAGSHTVGLDGIAANCAVDGANPRPVTVVAGGTAPVTLPVRCTATTGVVSVYVTTLGLDPDPDGYSLTVDGGLPRDIREFAVFNILSVAPGNHVVRIGGIAANCTVSGANPLSVTVTAGVAADAMFEVTCVRRLGRLRVTVATTGADPDRDGYAVLMDGETTTGGVAGTVPASGTVTIENVPEGDHTVKLTGVARNCTVSGPGVQPVRITYDATAEVTFAVGCVAPGVLRVTAATTGVDPDPDGYRVRVEGAGLDTTVILEGDAPATISALLPGNYRVTLGGVAANCDPVGPASQAVAVAAGSGALVPFQVTCAAATPLAFIWDSDMYVIKSNGTGLVRLTSIGENASPDWSPDRRKIAFTSSKNGRSGIYVMNADGSNVVRLSAAGANDHNPAWSPDGARIAFSSDRGGSLGIYVMNADGSNVVRLTSSGWDDDPAWSPDGTKIAFASQRAGYSDIYVMNADGSGVTRLTSATLPDFEPAWSPDGTRIAFTHTPCDNYYYNYCGSDIYVMNADGSGIRQLTTGIEDETGPTWSPDSRKIAFTSSSCDGDCSATIMVIRPDGSGREVLVVNGGFQPAWRR